MWHILTIFLFMCTFKHVNNNEMQNTTPKDSRTHSIVEVDQNLNESTLHGKTQLSKCVQDFTIDIYKSVATLQPNDNIFISPATLLVVMVMLHIGSNGDTHKQITRALKFQEMEKDAIINQIPEFLIVLKENQAFTLTTASMLCVSKDTIINDAYSSKVQKFQVDIKKIDYTNGTEKSRKDINKWVASHTNNKIIDVLPRESLNAQTGLAFVNAIYFKGDWALQFDPNETVIKAFLTSTNQKVNITMMRKMLKNVEYSEHTGLNCKALKIPYKGKEISMIVILPNKIDGLSALDKKLTLRELQNLMCDMCDISVDLTLPKFSFAFSLPLKKVLSDLGINDLFDQNKADLSGMGNGLYVSEMYHKAFIDVNEEGTEAAAAIGANIVERSVPLQEKQFIVDHPFLFMIWDNRIDAPLFIGRFEGPSKINVDDGQVA